MSGESHKPEGTAIGALADISGLVDGLVLSLQAEIVAAMCEICQPGGTVAADAARHLQRLCLRSQQLHWQYGEGVQNALDHVSRADSRSS